LADFATCDDSIAHAYVRVANALVTSKLGITRLNKLLKAAIKRGDHHGFDLLETIAPDSPAAVDELRKHANDGNKNAIRSLLVVGSTDHDDFINLGKTAAQTVRAMIADARGKDGTMSMTGYVNDQLEDLTLAAINTDDTKLWKEVTDALEACVIEETQQQRCIRRLAHRFQTLPPHVQRKLKKLAPNLRGTWSGTLFGGANDYAAAVAHLRIAAGIVPDIEVEAILLSERRENPVGLVRTLGAWNSERKLPFLATMAVDENPTVRAQAVFSIIEHANTYPDDRGRAFSVVRSAQMQDHGCALPDGIAQGLAKYPAKELATLENSLRNHQSAIIRGRFVEDE
jgi:ferritin